MPRDFARLTASGLATSFGSLVRKRLPTIAPGTAGSQATQKKGIDMADERKWGKAEGPEPPGGPGAMGSAEPPADDEAGGRSKQFVATCFNCGASSYIGADWKWFICWKCGSTSSEMVA